MHSVNGLYSKMELTKRQSEFDFLKVVSSFAVIMLHISASNWYATEVKSFEWLVMDFYNSMTRWAVPVFTMISGALFLKNNRNIEMIYRKHIARILKAFVFWSLLYSLPVFIRGG